MIYIWSSPWTKKYVLLCSSKNVCGVWLVNAFSKFCLQFISFFYKKCLKWLADTQPWPFSSHHVLHSYQRMQHYCESSLIFFTVTNGKSRSFVAEMHFTRDVSDSAYHQLHASYTCFSFLYLFCFYRFFFQISFPLFSASFYNLKLLCQMVLSHT